MSVVRGGTSSLSRGADPDLLLQCSSEAGAAIPEGKGWSQWPRMTSSAITQTHIRGVRLVHPNIFPTYDRLERGKGLGLWKDSCRISMTWGNGRIFERHFGEGPVMVVCPRPWLNQTSDSMQWTLAGGANSTNDTMCDTLQFLMPQGQTERCWREGKDRRTRCFFVCWLVFSYMLGGFPLGEGGCGGAGRIPEWGGKRDRGAWCEIPKESIKNYAIKSVAQRKQKWHVKIAIKYNLIKIFLAKF